MVNKNSNGDGSWRTLPSGSVNWVRWYTAKNGNKKKLSATGKDKTECRKKMKAEEERFEIESRMDSSTEGLLADNMKYWLYNKKIKDTKCSDTSFTRICSTFDTHIKKSYLGKTAENQINEKDINRFMDELKKHDSKGKISDDKLSYSSKKKVYDLLNMYFSDKYIRASELNPMLTVPVPVKEERYVKKEGDLLVEDDDDEDILKIVPLSSIWDDDEMKAIHEYCMRPYKEGKGGSIKRGPLVAFLMWTFMRAGELRALRWSDVCLEEGNESVSISKAWKKRKKDSKYEWYIGKPKSKSGIRNIQLRPEAVIAIKEYRKRFPPKNEDDFLMMGDNGKILCAKNLNDYVNNVLKGLNFDKKMEKNKTVHGLRHSGISWLIRNGVDRAVVSKAAGHSSTTITEQVYIEIIDKYCKNEIIKFDSYVRK